MDATKLPTPKELFHIGGDTPETVAAMEPDRPGAIASSATVNMTKSAAGHPKIYYKARDGREFLITTDLYAFPGEPMKVILHCPLCTIHEEHTLTITGDRKRIEWSPSSPIAMMMPDEHGQTKLTDMGGELSIEKFKCSWEIDTQKDVARGADFVIMSGTNLCTWRVVIDKNIARDA